MRKIILLFIFSVFSIFPESIEWQTSYHRALQEAYSQKKSLLVLITAPSWCSWCQEFEQNILTQEMVQEYITSNYIPLKLVDVVDGEANPELDYFNYSGYPTVHVYDYTGAFISDIYTQIQSQFLESLKKCDGVVLKEVVLPKLYSFNKGDFQIERGYNGEWILTTDGSFYLYNQIEMDIDYIYLRSRVRDEDYLLPINGTDGYLLDQIDGKDYRVKLPDLLKKYE